MTVLSRRIAQRRVSTRHVAFPQACRRRLERLFLLLLLLRQHVVAAPSQSVQRQVCVFVNDALHLERVLRQRQLADDPSSQPIVEVVGAAV